MALTFDELQEVMDELTTRLHEPRNTAYVELGRSGCVHTLAFVLTSAGAFTSVRQQRHDAAREPILQRLKFRLRATTRRDLEALLATIERDERQSELADNLRISILQNTLSVAIAKNPAARHRVERMVDLVRKKDLGAIHDLVVWESLQYKNGLPR